MLLLTFLSAFSIGVAQATFPLQKGDSINGRSNTLSERDEMILSNKNSFPVKCPQPSISMTPESPLFSSELKFALSNNFISSPCKGWYFYMTFTVSGSDFINPLIAFSGSQRFSSATHGFGVYSMGDFSSYLSLYGKYSDDFIFGVDPSYFDPPTQPKPSDVYFFSIDAAGVTIGVNNIIYASGLNLDMVRSAFVNGNIYLRAGSTGGNITISNINLFCKQGDTCNNSQEINKIIPPSQSNKNANLTCQEKNDTVVSTASSSNINYRGWAAGRFFSYVGAGDLTTIPTATGIFNVSFTPNNIYDISGMFSNYMYYYGTTFEMFSFGIESGFWSLGNPAHEVNTNINRLPSSGLRLFFALDPSGLSIGYNSTTVLTLGYDKFDMNDLLANGNVYFIPMDYGPDSALLNFQIQSIKRVCLSAPTPIATTTTSASATSASATSASATSASATSASATSASATSASATSASATSASATSASATSASATSVSATSASATSVSATSVSATSASATPTPDTSTAISIASATSASNSDTSNTSTSDIGTSDTSISTTPTPATSVPAASNKSACQSTITVSNMPLVISSPSKDYSKSSPIPIPCNGSEFVFNAYLDTLSDFFIALVDSDGVKSSDGFIEVFFGIKVDQFSVKKIFNASIRKREDNLASEKPVPIKLSLSGGILKVYYKTQLVVTFQVKNISLKSLLPIPFTGSATLSNATFNCVCP